MWYAKSECRAKFGGEKWEGLKVEKKLEGGRESTSKRRRCSKTPPLLEG